MKMTFSADKILYYNFFQENPKITKLICKILLLHLILLLQLAVLNFWISTSEKEVGGMGTAY